MALVLPEADTAALAATSGSGLKGQQILNGAHDFSIGSCSIQSAGQNINNQNTYNYTYVTESASLDSAVGETVLLKWLGGPDYISIRRSVLERRMEGTVTWFLELKEFKQLVDNTGVILWGTGLPGSGKTIISATCTDHLENTFSDRSDVAIAYALLRYSEKTLCRDIFAALIGQIIGKHDSALAVLQVVYDRQESVQGRKLPLTEREALNTLQDLVKLFAKVFLIIDGLDEADDNVKDGLLQALPPMGANLLITSRPLDLFTSYTPDAIYISIQAQTDDIDLYVTRKIEKSARLRMIIRGDQALTEELKRLVREKSHGMFLVAHLQMEAVLLKANSRNSLINTLKNLPSGTNDLYKEALARIEARSEEDILLARHVFMWLTYHLHAFMECEQLQRALSFSFETRSFDLGDMVPIDLLTSLCGGLIVQEGSAVRFVHYTALEYMRTVRFPGLPDPHVLLAAACITALEPYLEELQASSPIRGMSHVASTLLEQEDPMLSYAWYHWGKHANLSQASDGYGTIRAQLVSLLSKCTRFPVGIPAVFYGRSSRDSAGSGLHLAVAHGLIEIITSKVLPFPESSSDSRGLTPFHLAVLLGNRGTLNALLHTYAGVNLQTNQESSPLHLAIHRNRVPMVEQLLSFEGSQLPEGSTPDDGGALDVVDVNNPGADGEPPLVMACRIEAAEITRILVQHKDLDINARDQGGRTAFYRACIAGEPFATILLSAFPDLDATLCSDEGVSPFMKACFHGHEQLVSTLLKRDPESTRQVDNAGLSPLMWAVLGAHWEPGCKEWSHKFKCEEVVKLLLAFDPQIDINQRDNLGRTALMLTVLSDPPPPIHFDDSLLEHRSARRRTPKSLATFLLSQPGIDYDAPDNEGEGESFITLVRDLDQKVYEREADYIIDGKREKN
ncbi:ankyrin repeat-containing domain protein [Ephemerocybe angulata]|uniref:Ankyrin repeat-containing domain protein n=1 Tax=Ephemerocybe angulata TaxID=980116 RepID=A0A8H6HWA5_9AGAR|nr:ankyrin repeat-containing domain protein [Tulosesus angulatus]